MTDMDTDAFFPNFRQHIVFCLAIDEETYRDVSHLWTIPFNIYNERQVITSYQMFKSINCLTTSIMMRISQNERLLLMSS